MKPKQSRRSAQSGLFARTATGLVRGVPPRSSLIINFIPGHPTQTMVAMLLFALAVGAGGNPFLAILLVIPMSLVVLLRVRAAHADDPALGRRLHARQPRHPPRDRVGVGLLHDDGRACSRTRSSAWR